MADLARPGSSGAPDRLARYVVRLARLLESAADDSAAAAGLTRADAEVLLALRGVAEGRLSPTELAAVCGLSSGGTTNIVHRLTAAGYVNREANLSDGRSSWVQLTEEGSRLAGLVANATATGHARLLAPLPAPLTDDLARMLARAVEQLGGATGEPPEEPAHGSADGRPHLGRPHLG